MKLLLEELLHNLANDLSRWGIKCVEGQEFPLEISDQSLEDSKLPFYDPEHCDGFKDLPSLKQKMVSDTMVDANQHDYGINVGKALWNAATRTHYVATSKRALLRLQTHQNYIKDQYRYLDDQHVSTAAAQSREEAEAKNIKYATLTHAPQVVDQRSLAFAKTQLKFIEQAVLVEDPMAGTLATESMKEKYTPDMKAKFLTTERALKERIALYEARAKYNQQRDKERDDERNDLLKMESDLVAPLNKTLKHYRQYTTTPGSIQAKNSNILDFDSNWGYAQKLKQVQEQLSEVNRLVESLPTADETQKTLEELNSKMENLPQGPRFMFTVEYLDNIADLVKSGCRDTSRQIIRLDLKILEKFKNTLGEIKQHFDNREMIQSVLEQTKSNLELLLPELEKLIENERTLETKKKEREAASGSAEGLVRLKKESEAKIESIANRLRDIQSAELEENKAIETAKKAIDKVDKEFQDDIVGTETLISDLSAQIDRAGIQQKNGTLSDLESLERLENQITENIDILNTQGIPVSQKTFEELSTLLSWNESDIEQWQHITDNSTYSSLGRHFSRGASLFRLTQSPEQPLVDALEKQQSLVLKAIEAIRALNKKLKDQTKRLDNINLSKDAMNQGSLQQKEKAKMRLEALTSEKQGLETELGEFQAQGDNATKGFDALVQQSFERLNAETNPKNLGEIKSEFDTLEKLGGEIFDIRTSSAYKKFNSVYAEKTGASAPQLQIDLDISPSIAPRPAPAKPSLFDKYFHRDEASPDSEGLATKYLSNRAKDYALFDKMDSFVTSGLRLFACGSSKVRTDQAKRIDYLASIASALESYESTNNKQFLISAYNSVAKVLNNPDSFPARARKGSPAYEKSMRALLTKLITDLMETPALKPMIEEKERSKAAAPSFG